jgi:hypothetical protein
MQQLNSIGKLELKSVNWTAFFCPAPSFLNHTTENLCREISKWKKPCLTFSSPNTENLLGMGFNIIDG